MSEGLDTRPIETSPDLDQDLTHRVDGLHIGRDAGHKAAAAHRHKDGVQVPALRRRQVAHDLCPSGACPRYDQRVVECADEHLVLSQGPRLRREHVPHVMELSLWICALNPAWKAIPSAFAQASFKTGPSLVHVCNSSSCVERTEQCIIPMYLMT